MFDDSAEQRECPSCALPIQDDADVCPHCGYDLPRQKSSLKVAALVFVLLMIWPLIRLIQSLIA